MKTRPQNRNIIKTLPKNSKLKADSQIQGLKAIVKHSLVLSALARKGSTEQEDKGKLTAKTQRELDEVIAKLRKVAAALSRK